MDLSAQYLDQALSELLQSIRGDRRVDNRLMRFTSELQFACRSDSVNKLYIAAKFRSYCWDRLHAVPWKEKGYDTLAVYRRAHALASTFFILERMTLISGYECYVELLREVDNSLLLQCTGCAVPIDTFETGQSGYENMNLLHQLVTLLEDTVAFERHAPLIDKFVKKDNRYQVIEQLVTVRKVPAATRTEENCGDIDRCCSGIIWAQSPPPSLNEFRTYFFSCSQPVIIRGACKHWRCCTHWSLAYLLAVMADRIVPVEVGSDYTSAGSSLMKFSEFVHNITSPKAEAPLLYMAQHELLELVPELKKDVNVPSYCRLTEPTTSGEELVSQSNSFVKVLSWIGPLGTASRLHHDPHHNLLAQVKGCKYVRLYHASESDRLYPRCGRDSHCSDVDLLNWDRQLHPAVAECEQMWEGLLRPGDLLYIPPYFWHFLMAVDNDNCGAVELEAELVQWSCSLSFWWGSQLQNAK